MRRLRILSIAIGVSLLGGCSAAAAAPTWTYPPIAAADAASSGAGTHVGAMPMTPAVMDAAMPMPGASDTPASGAATVPTGGTIAIDAFDLGFNPAHSAVAAPGEYPVSFHNTGSTAHDVTFADGTR